MRVAVFGRMMPRSVAAGLLPALAMWAPALAEPPAKLLPAQSQIVFTSKQMGVPVDGSFTRFAAQVAFDPRKPEGGTVALQIDIGSATLGVPMSDAELPKPPWFDVARFPTARFEAASIKALGNGRFDVVGTLTLKGHAQPLTVPVSIAQSGGQSVATGSFVLQRLSFQVGEGEWTDTSVVANDVQVRFKLLFTGLGPL
jgi:polyisoprenoid-binding protein YceI